MRSISSRANQSDLTAAFAVLAVLLVVRVGLGADRPADDVPDSDVARRERPAPDAG